MFTNNEFSEIYSFYYSRDACNVKKIIKYK